MSEKHHHHNAECKCAERATAVQGLNELEFERGIWTAALFNDMSKLREQIARGETDRRDNFGYTALHYAARQNHAEACGALLSAGATVDAQTNAGGVTPLHRAASMGHTQIVRLLLAHGACAQFADGDGNTALHRAAAAAHRDTCAVLCAHDPELPVLVNHREQCPIDVVPVDLRVEFESILVGE